MTQGQRAALYRRRTSVDRSELRALARREGWRATDVADLDELRGLVGKVAGVVVADVAELGSTPHELLEVVAALLDGGATIVALEPALRIAPRTAGAVLAVALLRAAASAQSERRGTTLGGRGGRRRLADPARVAAMRAEGLTFRAIADALGVSITAAHRAAGADKVPRPDASADRRDPGRSARRTRPRRSHD